MIEERRKLAHNARLTYEREYGDSDDIHMEDVEGLEQEFAGPHSQQISSASMAGAPDDILALEEDPERIYHAYMAALESQAGVEDDEFEEEFEDIDPQALEAMLELS